MDISYYKNITLCEKVIKILLHQRAGIRGLTDFCVTEEESSTETTSLIRYIV